MILKVSSYYQCSGTVWISLAMVVNRRRHNFMFVYSLAFLLYLILYLKQNIMKGEFSPFGPCILHKLSDSYKS